jgi:voltage-gated potassium channel Kch
VKLHVDPPVLFSLRHKIYYCFAGLPEGLSRTMEFMHWRTAAWITSGVTTIVVIMSVVVFCVESLPQYHEGDGSGLRIVDYISMVWFTLDWMARMLTCPSKIFFFTQPMTYVDLLSTIPYYIDAFLQNTAATRLLIVVRLLRLTRVFRVLQLSRHNVGMRAAYGAFVMSRSGLVLFAFLLSTALFIGSAVIYMSEQVSSQYDVTSQQWYYIDTGKVSPFQSIYDTMWLSIVTLTTVGYGDMVPHTRLGKAVTSLFMLSGPFVLAFPTLILSSNFQVCHRHLSAIERAGVVPARVNELNGLPEAIRENGDVLMFRTIGTTDEHEQPSTKNRDGITLSYSVSIGAPARNVTIQKGVAFYDPLFILRCKNPHGETEYGFESHTRVYFSIRDNFPSGMVATFYLLLHTSASQEAATVASYRYVRDHPGVTVTAVVPRPIRALRVGFVALHPILVEASMVCTNYHDPFGTIPIEILLPRPEALPVLLRYGSSCKFKFFAEYYDVSSDSKHVDLAKFHVVAVDGARCRSPVPCGGHTIA